MLYRTTLMGGLSTNRERKLERLCGQAIDPTCGNSQSNAGSRYEDTCQATFEVVTQKSSRIKSGFVNVIARYLPLPSSDPLSDPSRCASVGRHPA